MPGWRPFRSVRRRHRAVGASGSNWSHRVVRAWDGYIWVLSMANRFERTAGTAKSCCGSCPTPSGRRLADRRATRMLCLRPSISVSSRRIAPSLRRSILHGPATRCCSIIMARPSDARRSDGRGRGPRREGFARERCWTSWRGRYHEDDDVDVSVLYRLAAGYALLRRHDEEDLWLERLVAPRTQEFWGMTSAATIDEGFPGRALPRPVARGRREGSAHCRRRWRHATCSSGILAGSALHGPRRKGEAVHGARPRVAPDDEAVAAEPPGPTLAPDLADPLFASPCRWCGGSSMARS